MAPEVYPAGATTVSPMPDQETVVLVNTFCAQTVDMLNAVSSTCERKLVDLARRIHGVEGKLEMLEAKLASVPRDDNERDEREVQTPPQVI